MFHENAIETCTKTCTAACIEAKSILRYGWGQASIKNRTSLPEITGSVLGERQLARQERTVICSGKSNISANENTYCQPSRASRASRASKRTVFHGALVALMRLA